MQTDQYLLFDYHYLRHNLGVIQTLNYWTQMVTSREKKMQKNHIRKCGYPTRAFLKSMKKSKMTKTGRFRAENKCTTLTFSTQLIHQKKTRIFKNTMSR